MVFWFDSTSIRCCSLIFRIMSADITFFFSVRSFDRRWLDFVNGAGCSSNLLRVFDSFMRFLIVYLK